MHASVKRRSQHADRSMGFAPQQKFGPAISEAAKLRCATVSAIKPPGTARWSEARLAKYYLRGPVPPCPNEAKSFPPADLDRGSDYKAFRLFPFHALSLVRAVAGCASMMER